MARAASLPIVPLVALASFATVTLAEEGMWTFDNPPRQAIEKAYGVELTDAWLDRLRLATVRIEGGCSASFISKEGLILTNHHCARTCIVDNSTPERDLMANGFHAARRSDEPRCQSAAVSVLVGMDDVTDEVLAATSGLAAAEGNQARKKQLTTLEQSCEEASKAVAGGPFKCEAVTLYQGGQYWLYRYKRYTDVRLVLAPENDSAQFGGDPDNFQFPRWGLDMTLLRAYENGEPAKVAEPLRFHWDGAKEGEAVFVAGHPGRTDRLFTVAELKAQRDAIQPLWLLRASELRGRLIEYGKRNEESARRAKAPIDEIENGLKRRRKQLDALLDDEFMDGRVRAEQDLRAKVQADPKLRAIAGSAWDDIARAQAVLREISVPYSFLEGGAEFNTILFAHARSLVRAAAERPKPNTERLREFTDAALPRLQQRLAAKTPVYDDLERMRLSFALERMREYLGPDDPLVSAVLGKESPDSLAAKTIEGTKLADPAVRLALYEGGQAAIEASDDPMIRLARAIDPTARALRKRYEDQVEGPTRSGQEAIARVRFALEGASTYPDATFSLRLSYGSVQGWDEPGGRRVAPFTTLDKAYERATGLEPFRLPQGWIDAASKLDAAGTRVNFVTNNDTYGGNSGSPMVNAAGEIVGLLFDGNIHSLSGSYWFDGDRRRTVGVHPQFIRAALEKVYRADSLLSEIGR
jgi:hypothetical protein